MIEQKQEDLKVRVGRRIRELREARQRENPAWVQAYVARRISVSPSLVSAYERGERMPPGDNIDALADLFGVSADYILCRTDDPTPMTAPRQPEPARCAKCGAEIRRGEIYCQCGEPLENFCIGDENHINRVGAKFCDQCGCRTIQGLSAKERQAYILAHRTSRSIHNGPASGSARARNRIRRKRM